MNYIDIYLCVIKNKKNYNLIFVNKKKKIWWNLIINVIWIKNFNIILKWHKLLCKQNGIKVILLNNWFLHGIKYNLIKYIFKK